MTTEPHPQDPDQDMPSSTQAQDPALEESTPEVDPGDPAISGGPTAKLEPPQGTSDTVNQATVADRSPYLVRDDLIRSRARATLVFSLALCALLLLGPLMTHDALYALLNAALLIITALAVIYRIRVVRKLRALSV
jgi:hypothetical protein